MWIVRLALRRPYTFVVVALLIVVLGIVSMSRMPTDIFPDVDIPVVSVVWSFTGISRSASVSSNSRRLGSATALNGSSVVAARAIHEIYIPMWEYVKRKKLD